MSFYLNNFKYASVWIFTLIFASACSQNNFDNTRGIATDSNSSISHSEQSAATQAARVPSADLTTVPPAARIIDTANAAWTISAKKTVLRNGVAAGYTANVVKLIYKDAKVYHQNSSGWFYSYDGQGGWVSSGDPLGSPTPAPTPSPTPAPTPTADNLWSNPKTWGGAVPVEGQDVTIPAGKTVILDINSASLGTLFIQGTLKFAEKNLHLTAAAIYVDGTLQIGSPQKKFTKKVVITLTGLDNTSFNRGIMAHGKLLLYGASPSKAWTQLGHHAEANATSIKLKEAVDWKSGDRIVIAPTDFFPGTSDETRLQEEIAETPNFTEFRTISASSGDTLALNKPLVNFHWGLLQYVTNSGISLVPDPLFTPPAEPFNRTLDERAEVGNLTRNIVIQSIDDKAWRINGYGANVMMMTLGSKAELDGVEFRRVGQSGKLGRYPFHWHMLSYDPATGNHLGDAVGHFVKNSTVSDSQNRCIVIHGTNGVLVQNNICFNIKGHAIFFEDAAERRNVVEGNLTLRVRTPPVGKALLVSEAQDGFSSPSGIWLTNPDNIVRNNVTADSAGPGIWLSYPDKPKRLSKLVRISPDNMKHGEFSNNVTHSNKGTGALLEMVEIDDAGNLDNNAYVPTSDEQENRWENRVTFELKGLVSYKNLEGGYRNRTSLPDYVQWTIADNAGVFVAGATQAGARFLRGLVVAESLNKVKPYPINLYPYDVPSAFASYHSQLDFINNVAVNFKVKIGKKSGVFLTDDYYTRPVDKGPVRNVGNRIINSDGGYRFLPVEYRNPAPANQYWTLAGALWDPHGYFGPKGNYWVYDMPFLTHGANCQAVAPAGQNGMSCGGEYFGVVGYYTDFDPDIYLFMSPIHVVRQTSAGRVIGTWKVGDGTQSQLFGQMRHFAARPGGEYILRFPNRPLAKHFITEIQNAPKATDTFLLAVAYGGRDTPEVFITTGHTMGPYVPAPGTATRKDARRAASLAEVRSATVPKYFVDRANNLIWVRYYGGLPTSVSGDAYDDSRLYKTHALSINGL